MVTVKWITLMKFAGATEAATGWLDFIRQPVQMPVQPVEHLALCRVLSLVADQRNLRRVFAKFFVGTPDSLRNYQYRWGAAYIANILLLNQHKRDRRHAAANKESRSHIPVRGDKLKAIARNVSAYGHCSSGQSPCFILRCNWLALPGERTRCPTMRHGHRRARLPGSACKCRRSAAHNQR